MTCLCPRSLVVGLTILLLTGTAAGLRAQGTRLELIAERQREKAQRLAPEESPGGEVLIERVLSSPLLSGSGGFYPWFGSVYPGAGFAAGAGFLHRSPRNARFDAMAAVAASGSMAVGGSWQLPAFSLSPRVQPFVDGRWARVEAVDFHGIGPDTSVDDHAPVDYRFREFNGGIEVAAGRFLTVSGGYGYLGTRTESDAPLVPSPGLGESIDYGVGRAQAVLDWRPSPGYAARGGFLRGSWQRYGARDGAPYTFQQYEAEAAQLVPIYREQFGLAFRALATTTRTPDGEEVPFILLPSVGGGSTVRGLANRRYQDRSRMVLTGEYRWRPSRYLDMAVFADTGAVARRLQDLEARRFVTAWGIGARFHGPAFTALRIDAARGPEGWRFVFTGGQPF